MGRFMDWIADGLDYVQNAIVDATEATWEFILVHFTYIAWGMIVVITVATLLAQPNPALIVLWFLFAGPLLFILRLIGRLRYDE